MQTCSAQTFYALLSVFNSTLKFPNRHYNRNTVTTPIPKSRKQRPQGAQASKKLTTGTAAADVSPFSFRAHLYKEGKAEITFLPHIFIAVPITH